MSLKKELLTSTSFKPITAMPVEAKGGVGKSTAAHILTLTLRDDDPSVLVVDTDMNNSTQSMVGDARAVDMGRINWEGRLLQAVRDQTEGKSKHLVFDFAAGQERHLRVFIGEMADAATATGGVFVVTRLVTSCGFVRSNIKTFADEILMPNMKLLLVKNMARVDDREDFDRWDGSPTRAMLLERGAVEIELENVGIALADRLVSHRLNFDAFAHGRWHEGAYPDIARKEFTEADQLSVARWLRRQKLMFHDALRALGA
jgi:hypothetical protein